MLFLIGLENMSRQEKIALLAQLRVITAANVLKDGTSKFGLQVKQWTLRQGSNVASILGRTHVSQRFTRWDKQTDWSGEVLSNAILRQQGELTLLTDQQLENKLWKELAKLAGVAEGSTPELIGRKVVQQLALDYKLDNWLYPGVFLEERVFEACLQEQLGLLKRKLKSLTRDEEAQVKQALHDTLAKLSTAEQEAIRQTMGLDQLSADSMMAVFKTASPVLGAQVLLSSTGFGAYLFLTTTMKALSLLLGTTFSFGTYTLATSALAFALSLPFLAVVTAVSGGVTWRKTEQKLREQLRKVVFLAGRTKMMA